MTSEVYSVLKYCGFDKSDSDWITKDFLDLIQFLNAFYLKNVSIDAWESKNIFFTVLRKDSKKKSTWFKESLTKTYYSPKLLGKNDNG